MAEGRGVEVLTTEQGWRGRKSRRKSMPKNCELIWILEVDWNGCERVKKQLFLGRYMHCLEPYLFFSEKVFFSLVNALLMLADFFLNICHFTAESVGERDTIQHWSELCDLMWSRKEIEGKEFRPQFVNTNSNSRVVTWKFTYSRGEWNWGWWLCVNYQLFSAFCWSIVPKTYEGSHEVLCICCQRGFSTASRVEFPHRSFHVQTSSLRCAKIDSGSNRRSKRRLGKGSMVDWVVGFTYIFG